MSEQTLSLSSGLANAAYAVGTVLAVQFAQHLPQRRMLVGYAVVLVIGSILAAAAQDPGMYIAGRILQGLATSLLLIAAVPPLAIGYPANKLRDTAVIMNMCIFGAVALGPFIGGLQAEGNAWRPLFWIVAAISIAALVLAVLTFEDAPPANLDSPRDLPAIALAAVGCVAAFFGASELTSHRFLDPIVIVPLLGGLAAIVALVVYQYRAKRPLLTVRVMLTSTIPVAGISVALFAAAASVSATVLTAAALAGHYSPLRIGVLYLPEVAGAVITAVVLGLVITKRAMHYLPLVGMLFLAAGIFVFALARALEPGRHPARLGPDRHRARSDRGARVVRGRLLAGVGQPAAGVRDRRALPGGGSVHDRPDLRVLRRERRQQLGSGDADRALGRLRARHRRRTRRCRSLRARRRPPTDPRPPALPRGPAPCLVLAAAARKGSRTHGRQLRSQPKAVTDMTSTSSEALGPVLFAYDGSELAELAIEQAGRELAPGRAALVLCVWQPADVGFIPVDDRHFNAQNATEVQEAAEQTAAHGATLAEKAGFHAQSLAVEAAPTWKGIVKTAEEHQASLIVLGSHRRSGLTGHLIGSVAAAVVAHSQTSVLVVH